MKKILILGAGTGGTMMANKLRKELEADEWSITIIDQDNVHYYQPGFLFVPFGINSPKEIKKTKREFIPAGVDFVITEITNINWEKRRVTTKAGGFSYDILIIGTGCRIMPEEVEGMMAGWEKNIFSYYTYESCQALAKALKKFEGGRMVINIAEMPIKCPVAPLEYAFLVDWHLTERGIRDKTEIEFVTPLPGAFTKPVATKLLTQSCIEKNIKITPNFNLGSVDAEKKVITSHDGREVAYDMLVSIPPNFGSQVIIDSGIGDAMGYVPVDKETLQPKGLDNVWVIGDATNVPTSKAGAVAHFEADILMENIKAFIEGGEQHARFDGHAL